MESSQASASQLCANLLSPVFDDNLLALESFHPDCVFDTDHLWTWGVANMRRALLFNQFVCRDSGIIGEAQWDQSSRTLSYTYYHTLYFPHIRVVKRSILHLAPATPSMIEASSSRSSTTSRTAQGERWVVVKIGETGLNSPLPAIPLVGQIYLYIWRPIFTFFVLSIAFLAELWNPRRRSQPGTKGYGSVTNYRPVQSNEE